LTLDIATTRMIAAGAAGNVRAAIAELHSAAYLVAAFIIAKNS
jgi:hypothetical protein